MGFLDALKDISLETLTNPDFSSAMAATMASRRNPNATANWYNTREKRATREAEEKARKEAMDWEKEKVGLKYSREDQERESVMADTLTIMNEMTKYNTREEFFQKGGKNPDVQEAIGRLGASKRGSAFLKTFTSVMPKEVMKQWVTGQQGDRKVSGAFDPRAGTMTPQEGMSGPAWAPSYGVEGIYDDMGNVSQRIINHHTGGLGAEVGRGPRFKPDAAGAGAGGLLTTKNFSGLYKTWSTRANKQIDDMVASGEISREQQANPAYMKGVKTMLISKEKDMYLATAREAGLNQEQGAGGSVAPKPPAASPATGLLAVNKDLNEAPVTEAVKAPQGQLEPGPSLQNSQPQIHRAVMEATAAGMSPREIEVMAKHYGNDVSGFLNALSPTTEDVPLGQAIVELLSDEAAQILPELTKGWTDEGQRELAQGIISQFEQQSHLRPENAPGGITAQELEEIIKKLNPLEIKAGTKKYYAGGHTVE